MIWFNFQDRSEITQGRIVQTESWMFFLICGAIGGRGDSAPCLNLIQILLKFVL